MIVDAHTHIFPPSMIARREALVRSEPVFGELYANPDARMATAAELLAAMDEAGVDHAVIAGFAWSSEAHCRAHNDALLEAAHDSGGRFSAFCSVPLGSPSAVAAELSRCAAAGARGFGELRAEALSVDLRGGPVAEALAEAAQYRLPLLFHASEPVGHAYAGKEGQSLGPLWSFIEAHPEVTTILAHLGGGLPLYAFMPEVAAIFARTYVDTAAVPWLYRPAVYAALTALIGVDRILFGSDFPLRHPARDLAILRSAGLAPADLELVLGGSAARLLGLEETADDARRPTGDN